MRPMRSSLPLCRAISCLAIALLIASSGALSLTAAAQADVLEIEGSPESLDDPIIEPAPTDEAAIGADPVDVPEPVSSLVIPVVMTVDTTGPISTNDPCFAIDPSWVSVVLDALSETFWTSTDGTAGGSVFVDVSTLPITLGWDALGGGTVGGVIVPDAVGVPAALANFYDYRPFGGSVGGDAGLVAPSGLLSQVFLCLVAPPATSTVPPTETASDSLSPTATGSLSPATEISTNAGAEVQPAAIGIGSTVQIAEPLNLRTSPGLDAGVITVLETGTFVTVVGGPQAASGFTWWQLSTPSGTGWSVSTYLIEQPAANTPTRTVTRTPSRTPTVTPTIGTGAIGIGSSVRVTQRLNLRQAAGTSATVVTVMPAGTLGTVLDGPQSANGMSWWQITTPAGTGWAAANYLAPLSGGGTSTPTQTPSVTRTVTTPTVTSTVTVSQTGTVQSSPIVVGDLVRTTARINLRTAPGTQATVVTVLPTGSQGAVIGGPANASALVWWQLQTASGTGWVAAPYLVRVGVAPSATASLSPTMSSTPTITRTPSATRTPTRTATRTLTPSVTATVGQCGGLGYGDIARTNSSVNFRSTPSTAGAIIRTLAEGERGTVRGGPATANGFTWCQLQIGSATGWVANQFLVRVSGPAPTPNGTVTPRPDPPDDPGTGSASVIYSGSANSGMIALTFDAGADRGQAAYILDVLADYGVQATFGMTGTWARDNPDLVARMVAEGHQIINHTWSHPSFTGGSSSTTVLTRAARLDQLDRAEAIVEQETGYVMQPYWRPPYGDISASVLRDVYAGGYYVTVMWSCDTLGWNGASEQAILNRCMYPMGAGDIILMHVGADGLDWAATDNMIRYFQSQGLQIVTIEEMLGS